MDLTKLQQDLDTKKWHDSVKQQRDMCGDYDYCLYCQSDIEEPCAQAYQKFQSAATKSIKKESAEAKKNAIKTAPAKAPAKKKAAK